MATIKSYTSLQQSRKLAEILTFESADMTYYRVKTDWRNNPVDSKWGKPVNMLREELALPASNFTAYEYLPCWSLAALLNILPPYLYEWEKGIDFSLYPSVAKKRWWCAGYISQDLSPENKDKFTLITHADNPVDACYEMILKLNELKML